MSKGWKLILGAITLWPGLYFFLFMAFLVVAIINHDLVGPNGFVFLFLVHLLTMVWIIALLGFYITHAYRNANLTESKKVIWILILFLGSAIAMPVYWYYFIWSGAAERLMKT